MDNEISKQCKQRIVDLILEGKIDCIKCQSVACCFLIRNRFLIALCRKCEDDDIFCYGIINDKTHKRCICRYCNSMAVQKIFIDYVTYFICEQCGNNIIRSKMQICNDPECIYPLIRDLDSENYYIGEPEKCQVCERYLNHLHHGFKTHFTNMDFSRSLQDLKDNSGEDKFYCGRAAAVQKYLQK